MKRQRKTRDRWDIETNSGYGWDFECSEYTLKAARQTYKEYRENSFGKYAVRITKKREKI